MMRGLYRHRKPEGAAVEAASLAGVGGLVLALFLLQLVSIREPRVEVTGAGDAAAAQKRRETVVIAVTTGGTIHVGGRRLELSVLRPELRRLLSSLPRPQVVVMADEACRAAVIARVIDECKLAGAEGISFSTRPEARTHGS